MKTVIEPNMSNFSWEQILIHSPDFKRNPYNSNIFLIPFLADLAVSGDEMHIHPGFESTFIAVADKLSDAVSAYYQRSAVVTISDYVIYVRFL